MRSSAGCLTGWLLLLSIYIALYLCQVLPNHVLVNSPASQLSADSSHALPPQVRSGEAGRDLAQGYLAQGSACDP